MTAATATAPPGLRPSAAPHPLAGGAVVAAGVAWLYVRPGGPLAAVAMFTCLGVVGLVWPVAPLPHRLGAPPVTVRWQGAVAAIGIGAFAIGRVLGGGRGLITFGAASVILNTLAAVAEEAFFRRLVLGLLAPAGPVVAIAGSAGLFAIVHIAAYGGSWIVPIDVMAGALLGWQRWSSRSLAVPTVTHVVANLLALG